MLMCFYSHISDCCQDARANAVVFKEDHGADVPVWNTVFLVVCSNPFREKVLVKGENAPWHKHACATAFALVRMQ